MHRLSWSGILFACFCFPTLAEEGWTDSKGGLVTTERRCQEEEPLPVEQLKKRCEAGDQRFCPAYGVELLKRDRVKEAKVLFSAACANGVAAGCANLGARFFMEQNLPEAIRLSSTACSKENGTGCANLGVHEIKMGRIQSGISFFTSGCSYGSCTACRALKEHSPLPEMLG